MDLYRISTYQIAKILTKSLAKQKVNYKFVSEQKLIAHGIWQTIVIKYLFLFSMISYIIYVNINNLWFFKNMFSSCSKNMSLNVQY